MVKNSNSDTDGVTWGTAALPLGTAGLDLRTPSEPGTLTKLLNSRFLDSKTLARRTGHIGQAIQTQGDFVTNKRLAGNWVYGHGAQLVVTDNEGYTGAKHPIQTRGGGTFQFGDSDVVWTGDRLLVAKADGPFYGSRLVVENEAKEGVTAYLPVQTDTLLPEVVTGYYVDMGLTRTQKVIALSGPDRFVTLLIVDRVTDQIVNRSRILGGEDDPKHVKVVISGAVPLVFYINNGTFNVVAWDGVAWSNPNNLASNAVAYEVTEVSGGCHVVYRVDNTLFATNLSGGTVIETPHASQFELDIGGTLPDSAVGCSSDPNGNLAVAWGVSGLGGGLYTRVYNNTAAPITDLVTLTVSEEIWNRGLSVCFRGLSNEDGRHPYVVHGGQLNRGVSVYEVVPGYGVGQSFVMHNSEMVTKSFRVGNEIFAWLLTKNSNTSYLMAGVYKPNICGYADREETLPRESATGVSALASVCVDPLSDGTRLAWIRTYDVGHYARPDNAKIGYINFLPSLSTAEFGKSVYLAGSNCRNWDGRALVDAGFHDYPTASSSLESIDSGLTLSDGLGDESQTGYQYRIYPVKYNALGERFQGVAVSSPVIQAALAVLAVPSSIVLTIKTIPCTNHDDVVFEIYRTPAGGTVFYLEDTMVNTREDDVVSFFSVMADSELVTRVPDPHAVTVGGLSELEESAPLGCAILVTASDRLWGIGGQVPQGVAQYSKLYESGEGAGFDALAGTQVVDATGGEITSIASNGDARVVLFQRDKLFVLTGDGPNNFSGDTGTFGVPQVVLSDGALNHSGTITLPIGIAYWGAGGPKILGNNFQSLSISEPVEPLASTMTPTGARVDLARREVVWYTGEGRALLLNYMNGPRWAEWSGLPVAGCSKTRLVTVDGRLLTPSADVGTDDGRRFSFELATGNIRPDQLLTGGMRVRRIGFSGKYNGYHRVKFKIFYNGSPLWSEKYRWLPSANTWLAAMADVEDLTPAELDALGVEDHSGAYSTSRRVVREVCRYFRVEVSDCGDNGFTPWELSFEIGALPGMGRTAVNTFTE